jgi:transcriptional regulator with XRE-family HTH domain
VDFHTGKKALNVSGPQIRRIRNALCWSQPELAAKCQLAGWDVSRDIIARIECRTRWVGDFELAILADVLKVSIGELLPERERSAHPPSKPVPHKTVEGEVPPEKSALHLCSKSPHKLNSLKQKQAKTR